MAEQIKITVAAEVQAPVSKVWEVWNNPDDIIQWNTPDPSWHTTENQNDLRENGQFKSRMEAKDGSFGFDFEGRYDTVIPHKEIAYTMPDGRTARTTFEDRGSSTYMTTVFDAETQNAPEFQKQGWQAILNNFVKHVERKS